MLRSQSAATNRTVNLDRIRLGFMFVSEFTRVAVLGNRIMLAKPIKTGLGSSLLILFEVGRPKTNDFVGANE